MQVPRYGQATGLAKELQRKLADLQRCKADLDSIQRMQSLSDASARNNIWKRCVLMGRCCAGCATACSCRLTAGRWSRCVRKQTPFSMHWTNTTARSAGQPTRLLCSDPEQAATACCTAPRLLLHPWLAPS